MSSRAVLRPENALKRAEELVSVGHKDAAIKSLSEMLNKRHFRQWQKPLEDIAKRFVDLCVESRKAKFAKDGLYNFRLLCQSANSASLEEVLRHFLNRSETKVSEVRALATAKNTELEAQKDEQSIESLFLTSVTGESPGDRNDRSTVTPWLKFLWESYRTVLELLKSNPRLEALYQETAHRALEFCKTYERKTDFRRLGELLHNHLNNLIKYQNQSQGVNINVPETLQAHLETRFKQLNTAISLELWQEAFKSIEDIHQLISIAKKLRPQMMALYYEKLAQIFWISKDYLYHAFALVKLFKLSKSQNKSLTKEDSQRMASMALLAVLSVPVTPEEEEEDCFDFNIQKEKNFRVATLLGYSTGIRRELLIDEVRSRSILSGVLPELAELFEILETRLGPLELARALAPKIAFVKSHEGLKQYADPLERLAFLRIIQKLSHVYESMSLSKLHSLVSFIKSENVEKLTVDAIKRRLVDAKIDFQQGAIHFGCQALDSAQLRSQLTILSKRLQESVNLIAPVKKDTINAAKAHIFSDIQQRIAAEHEQIKIRKQVIEERKQKIELEEKRKLRLREEEEQRRQQELRQQALERQRQLELQEEEQKQRIANQIAVASQTPTRPPWAETVSSAIGSFKGVTAPTARAPDRVPGLDDDEETEQTLAPSGPSKAEQLAKEREELQKKLKKIASNMRFLERAVRDAEIPLLEEWAVQQNAQAREQHELRIATEREIRKKRHEQQLAEKQRFIKALPFKADFEKALSERRSAIFEKLKTEQDERMKDLRERIATLREQKRKAEERRQAEEERARQAAEERRKKQQSEKERAIQELETKRLETERQKQEERKRQAAESGQPTWRPGGNRPWRQQERSDDEPDRESQPSPSDDQPRPRWGDRTAEPSEDRVADRPRWGDRAASEHPSSDEREDRSRWGDRGAEREESGDRSRWSGDRSGGDREERGGERRWGGDRGAGGDREERGGDRRWGGDRGAGSDRSSGDREERGGERRSWGGDRAGGDRAGGDRSSGDREERGSERRWGGDRAGGDRSGGDREERGGERRWGGDRGAGGDRAGGDREERGGERRWGGDRGAGGDRAGGDREERGGERRWGGDRSDRSSGDREERGGERRWGGDRGASDRGAGDRGASDRGAGDRGASEEGDRPRWGGRGGDRAGNDNEERTERGGDRPKWGDRPSSGGEDRPRWGGNSESSGDGFTVVPSRSRRR